MSRILSPGVRARQRALAVAHQQSTESRLPESSEIRGQVVVDGVRLETLTCSAAHGAATMVMLHEGLGSVSLWKDFPAKLAAATDCSVVGYSRRGHGKSDRLKGPRCVQFMHDEASRVLPALLEQLAIHKPILLGHSDGASIALIYASAHPGNVRALILEAPHVFVENFGLQSIAKIRDVYRATDLPKKLARYHDHPDEVFWGWNNIWLDPAFRSWNIETGLPAITCPLLVIQGTEDEYGTLAQVAAIKQAVPQTELLVVENCGHSPHRDQEAATLEGITQFVRKLA